MMNILIAKRRQILGCLIAVASSCVLIACGGGGADVAATLDGNANQGLGVSASRTSDNGTIAPPASSVVDVVGNVWTVSNAHIYKNGTQDPNAYNVSMLLLYSNFIYHKDSGGNFFQWTGSNWEKCADPQVVDTAPTTDRASPWA
jgi:hypothetical protein